jgi:hypothetical protein
VRIVAAFTGDAAQHDAALRPGLRHPDRLAVESRQHSLSDLRRVREEIDRTLRQRQAQTGRPILASVGIGKAVISVGLRADQEHVASELASRHGSAVELRVGFFDFPERRRSRPRPPATPAPAPGEQAFEGLEMGVEVDQKVLEAGDDGHVRLVLRNSSPERIGPLGAGQPLVGSLLNSSLQTVGGYSGAVAGTGRFIDLAPGGSASVRFIFGTASTREDLGYVVPPGRYWLRVQMPLHHGRGPPNDHARRAPDADHDHPPSPGTRGSSGWAPRRMSTRIYSSAFSVEHTSARLQPCRTAGTCVRWRGWRGPAGGLALSCQGLPMPVV